jgi:hypothetical protein
VGAYHSYPTVDVAAGTPTLILAGAIPVLAMLPFATAARGRRRG